MFPELISRAPSNQGGLGNILKELVDRSYEFRVMASAFGSHGTLRQLYGETCLPNGLGLHRSSYPCCIMPTIPGSDRTAGDGRLG